MNKTNKTKTNQDNKFLRKETFAGGNFCECCGNLIVEVDTQNRENFFPYGRFRLAQKALHLQVQNISKCNQNGAQRSSRLRNKFAIANQIAGKKLLFLSASRKRPLIL